MVSSYRLLMQTTVVSGTVWPQFTMQVLTGGCEPPVWGRGGRRGLISFQNSPVVISYRLPYLFTYLSPFSQCCRLKTDIRTNGRTDGRNWSLCSKMHRPPTTLGLANTYCHFLARGHAQCVSNEGRELSRGDSEKSKVVTE